MNVQQQIPESVTILVKKLDDFFRRELRKYFESEIEGDRMIDPDILERSGYADHFPHQLMSENGRYLTPASCLHVYPSLTGTLERAQHILITCNCSRRENEEWSYPYRLPNFDMLELVVVADEETVQQLRHTLQKELPELFSKLSLAGDLRDATDAFFLSEHEGARLLQKMKSLKQEFTMRIDDEDVALASLNYHEYNFAKRFEIVLPDGDYAHSLCMAFGLQRIAFAGMPLWKDGTLPREAYQ